MSMNMQPDRIERLPRQTNPEAFEDQAVLRLSRNSLRAEPPVVQFVGRVSATAGQQRLLWPA